MREYLLVIITGMIVTYVSLVRKVAIFSGGSPDEHHLHHRLLKLGHSHRSSVMITYGRVGLPVSCMVAISYVPPHSPDYLVLVLSVTFLVALMGAAATILLPRPVARKALTEQLAEAREPGPHRPRDHV